MIGFRPRILALLILPTLLNRIAAQAHADEPPPPSVAEIQAARDRALIGDLLRYLDARPDADDREQAHMLLFNTAIDHDWFDEVKAPALAYLAREPDGAVRPLAQIIATMARAQAGQFPEALKTFHDLVVGLDQADQEEFAVNFTEALAGSAASAGRPDVAREAFRTLADRFPQSPALLQKVRDDLARLDRIGRPVPPFEVRDLADRPIRADDLKGKYTLIDFWATWCVPCVAELPNVEAAYAKYHDRGFEVLAVSLDDAPKAVAEFASARKLPWPQVHNATSGGDLVEVFGVGTIPSTYLIDPDGKIVRLDLRGKALDRALGELIR